MNFNFITMICTTMNNNKKYKLMLEEMNELYQQYNNWTPDTKGFDFKTAEGIKLCIDIVKKFSNEKI